MVRLTLCPAVYSQVCGCDVQTYANSCRAGASGQAVALAGRSEVDIVGSWEQKLPSGAEVEYNFAADGTFTSGEQLSCVFGYPACMGKLALGRGTCSVSDWTVNLAYVAPTSHAPNASFVFASSGSTDHMQGADYDSTLDLICAS